ncbi:diguanylate cyclase domain-containing protein [Hansschlegelia quercus]|uniref:GGDEF domain-containing protein n=1 Tax=Hansschlegelia quercus TaxID=2528245 RepID=A0A4Q9GL85_9HYPH|nr:GGDEF domain-containing protein [Hansschlegelia quercus]TBN55159.1 GGDEF domain-containing protein [Hansschlegelia quercus]
MEKRQRAAAPSPQVHVELVQILYSAILPIGLIGGAYIGVGLTAMSRGSDPVIVGLTFAGASAALLRLLLTGLFRGSGRQRALTPAAARRWEWAYGLCNVAFGLCLGALGARTFAIHSAELELMSVALLSGYCAGQVTRICIRPWICVPSIAAAALPIIGALFWRGGQESVILGAFLLFFLFASFETIAYGYRTALTLIASRQQVAALARRDPLTGLLNRTALQDFVDAAILKIGDSGTMVAIHCLDLDRFKPVNDVYGHPTGDALLTAVAGRLTGLLRPGDAAIRLGGDEFVVVQTDIAGPAAAEMLARRMVRALGMPFRIDGRDLRIGVSIGIALARKDGDSLGVLLTRGDEALYAAKASGRNGFRFVDPADGKAGDAAMVRTWTGKQIA